MQRIDEITNTCLSRLSLLAVGLDVKALPTKEAFSIVKFAIETYANEQKQPKEDPFYESTFKTFYEKYGKKVGRVVAYRRWLKLKKSDVEAIMDTVIDFVLAHPDPQYRPHPATYLAQKRWLDELPGKRVAPTGIIKGRENTWKYGV